MKARTHKRFIINVTHKGYPVELSCTAKSIKEAAVKFNTTESFVRSYGLKTEVEEPIDSVMGLINSGYIIFEYDRKDLSGKIMPFEELKAIIEHYVELYHKKRWEQIQKKSSNNGKN